MNTRGIITIALVLVILGVVAVQVAAFVGTVPKWLITTARIGGVAAICGFMLYDNVTRNRK